MVIPLLNWYLNNGVSRKTLYFYNVLQFPVVIPLQNRYLNNDLANKIMANLL